MRRRGWAFQGIGDGRKGHGRMHRGLRRKTPLSPERQRGCAWVQGPGKAGSCRRWTSRPKSSWKGYPPARCTTIRRADQRIRPPILSSFNQPDGATLGMGQFRSPQAQPSQRFGQHVCRRRQQQPQLIGLEATATGAVGEQVQLLLFDAVFHLATLAVEPVIELLRIVGQAGDHETRIIPLHAALGFG